ncbi:hypothetical protein LIPSTDRAFT_71852 [Lipomyces starkeyi NRRL Y-11557]|uniref:Uncharacterized protein n=1 Tax=Lipomyces starkeyi NRRL Y-11557 TaxID=675824 RepID=A0A1E3Q3T1_LIPST|nr:hypothetical protein LIPSTDRAFT_71852 [Lipomyces starkeyi NRRL Y-11557]
MTNQNCLIRIRIRICLTYSLTDIRGYIRYPCIRADPWPRISWLQNLLIGSQLVDALMIGSWVVAFSTGVAYSLMEYVTDNEIRP